jgi:hypothetical protein
MPNPTDTYRMYAKLAADMPPMKLIQVTVHSFSTWPKLGKNSPTERHRAPPNSNNSRSRTARRNSVVLGYRISMLSH